MPRLLFTVTDRFLIRGRGVVVFPGIATTDTAPIKIGDPILLKRPDGTTLPWTIGGIEMISGSPKLFEVRREMPILLTGLDKEDVPVGTEIWTRVVDQR